ncbi:TIM barrel protein [Nocardia gipuzkoensis]
MKFYSFDCSANTSTIYRRLPALERPMAAANAGYSYVESWWPFENEAPSLRKIRDFSSAHLRAGVRLEMINLDAGSYAHGDRGLLSIQGGDQRIRESVEQLLDILQGTGCRLVNVPWGNCDDPADCTDDRALERLAYIADRVADCDARVTVEMLNVRENPRYRITSLTTARRMIHRANLLSRMSNVGLLLDTYHLAMARLNAAHFIRENGAMVCHVQIADVPGRGRPGTGNMDFRKVAAALNQIGYNGRVGMEYFE